MTGIQSQGIDYFLGKDFHEGSESPIVGRRLAKNIETIDSLIGIKVENGFDF